MLTLSFVVIRIQVSAGQLDHQARQGWATRCCTVVRHVRKFYGERKAHFSIRPRNANSWGSVGNSQMLSLTNKVSHVIEELLGLNGCPSDFATGYGKILSAIVNKVREKSLPDPNRNSKEVKTVKVTSAQIKLVQFVTVVPKFSIASPHLLQSFMKVVDVGAKDISAIKTSPVPKAPRRQVEK